MLVKLLKDCPQHGAYAGEVLGLNDDVAEKLIKAKKATLANEVVASEPAPEPKPEPNKPEPTKPEIKSEPAAGDDDDDDGDDDNNQAPRRRGRPRKNID